MSRRTAALVLAFVVALACVVGCSDDAADSPSDGRPDVTTPRKPVTGTLVVLAEPQLAPSMDAAVPTFQQANPEASVTVEPLAASDIVARVQAGEGDVVALADAAAMDELEGNGLVAAVVPLPGVDGARVGAVVASANPSAATRFVETPTG